MKSLLKKSSEAFARKQMRALTQPPTAKAAPYAVRLVLMLNSEAKRDGFFCRIAGQELRCNAARLRKAALQVRIAESGKWETPGILTFRDPYGLEICLAK